MTNVTIFHNGADPEDFTTYEQQADTCACLLKAFGAKFPDTARIYHDVVALDHDVTPANNDEDSIARLQALEGNIFVVVWPEGIELIIAIVAIAIAAVAIGLTFIFRPKTQGQNEGSPNNELSDRQNKARPNERIAEIVGTVRATPDLLALPYKFFVANQEFEYNFGCVTKGTCQVLDCKDDITPIDDIDGEYVAVFPPFTSPNDFTTNPQATFGTPPPQIPPVVGVVQSTAVNGQVCRAPNSGNLETNNNVAFKYGGLILTNDPNIDFTEYFTPSTLGSPQYLKIATNDDGVNASDSGGQPSVGLAGTYQISAVSANQITLATPATVNANWNALATYAGQTSTYFHTFAITGSGSRWVGPFILSVEGMTEVWANFVGQQGLYYVDNKGRQGALTATVQLGVQAVDENFAPIGDEITATANITGSALERNIVGCTLKCGLPSSGAVQVRALLLTNMGTDSRNTYVQEIQWRELFGITPTKGSIAVESTANVGCLLGAFTDASGIVKQLLNVGNGPITFIAPANCSQLQLGNNSDQYLTNTGAVNITVTNNTTTDTWTGNVDAKNCPYTVAANPGLDYSDYNYIGPLVVPIPVNPGDSITIKYNSGLWNDDINVDANGDPFNPSGSSLGGGTPPNYFATHYMATYTGDNFGDITTYVAVTAQTQDALAVKERKINMLVTRCLPTWINRGAAGPPQMSTDLFPTNNAADIIVALATDPANGRRTIEEIDVPGIYAVADSAHLGGEHVDGEIATYFGSFLMTEFCYTLDDSQVSFEEIMADIGQAINCIAYRQGSTLSISFEKKTADSSILFNHRNKLPNSETRTVTFGPLNDNDGIEYTYIDPNSPNYPQQDSSVVLYYPADQSAINPKKITSIGVRNPAQATLNAWRMYQKLLNANQQTVFTATSEAAQCLLNERVLVADDTRSDTMAGEIASMSGLTVKTSQPSTMLGGHTYTAFFQLYDDTVQAIAVTPGVDAFHLVLAAAPSLSLVTDPTMYAKTTYLLVDNGAVSTTKRALAFLISDKAVDSNSTFKLTCINYADAYYLHDQDIATGVVVPPPAGYSTQGYIGIGLVTPTGGTYTPPARGSFSLSSYNGSALQKDNNVPTGQQVVNPPQPSTSAAPVTINGTSTAAPTVNFGVSPAAPAGSVQVVFATGGNSDLMTASASVPKAAGANLGVVPVSAIEGCAGITVDGGGSVPLVGTKGFIQMPYPGTITGWSLVADQAGSIVMDVKKATFATFPTTASITASAKPTLTTTQKATSTTLTGWTTALALGDLLEFDITSITTLTRVVLQLFITKG